MGNSVSNSKDRHGDEIVDYGYLCPQGVYTGPQDWNLEIATNLIIDRKLAPFYRPLEDYDDSWDDEQILAARKPLPESHPNAQAESAPTSSNGGGSKFHHKQASKSGKEAFRPSEASVYRTAVECPICFLYYPPNINRSRCCDHPICTECFVQIKRAEPTTTHLVSEPACCPYCVQDNFGVTYEPPSWRVGLVRDGHSSSSHRPDIHKTTSGSSTESGGVRRRKSFGPDNPDVVTIDQIRPDWEAKLAAVRAAVARRANRRIIMRQVGDRLIPIGVTSGRVVTAEGAEGTENVEGSGRRRRRHQQQAGQDLNQLLGIGPLGGPDLEELMVMEAMRLSLLEHEQQQRRQAAENNANNDENAGNENGNAAPTENGRPPSAGGGTDRTPSPPAVPSVTPLPAPSGSTLQLSPHPRSLISIHRRSPSPSLVAALSAAHTASVFLNPQGPAESNEHVAPRGTATPSPDPIAMASPEPNATDATPRRSWTVELIDDVQSGSQVPETSEAASSSSSRPTLDHLTVELMDADASPGPEDSQVPEGYKPLPSSLELSDPLLLGWEEGADAQQGGSESKMLKEPEAENGFQEGNSSDRKVGEQSTPGLAEANPGSA